MGERVDPSAVDIVFPPSRDVREWAAAHSVGDRPDKWPYGLHRVNTGNVVPFMTTPLTASQKVKLVLALTRSSTKDASGRVAVAWEENTAAKMLVQYPASRMYSGVIWASDVWEERPNGPRAIYLRQLLKRMDGLWCLSRPQVEVVQKHTSNNVPVSYLPFGIDHTFFPYQDMTERLSVLSLGVDRDRDPDTLFAALEIVHAKQPRAEILVQTDSRRTLPVGVRRIERVPHSELPKLYARSRVVVVPTKQNLHASGMTVALEGGSSGRPVIACETPGMDDYVVPNITGLLVPPGQPVRMAEAILAVLDDQEWSMKLGASARKHIEDNHTSEAMAKSLDDIIAG